MNESSPDEVLLGPPQRPLTPGGSTAFASPWSVRQQPRLVHEEADEPACSSDMSIEDESEVILRLDYQEMDEELAEHTEELRIARDETLENDSSRSETTFRIHRQASLSTAAHPRDVTT